MCGAGVEDHYLQLLEEEKQDQNIEHVLFANNSFARISFSTISISVPSKP